MFKNCNMTIISLIFIYNFSYKTFIFDFNFKIYFDIVLETNFNDHNIKLIIVLI